MFMELQKTMDDSDAAKGNSEQLQKEIADTKSLLNKRQNELQLLRGLLLLPHIISFRISFSSFISSYTLQKK